MSSKEKIEKFLEFQKKGLNFKDIAIKMDIKPSTLRGFLNRNGYKSEKGTYIPIVENKDDNNSALVENKNNKLNNEKKEIKKPTKKNTKVKRDKKINITEEDMDKLCEVYDWYLQVKDNKSMKSSKSKKNKDILLEEENIKDLKSVSIRVDKNTWSEFERLCSNSSYNKQQIITQALKDFMKKHKNLL